MSKKINLQKEFDFLTSEQKIKALELCFNEKYVFSSENENGQIIIYITELETGITASVGNELTIKFSSSSTSIR